MMAAYNLVVTNQSGVHTCEKKIARSVLDLMFASPEVTKNILKGGWSLQRMNRNKFLQRISAANLEGSATAEVAEEILMRKEAATEASITCTSLMRLMPNVGGLRSARRQLLATVVESIQLYGAPTWAYCIPAYLVDKQWAQCSAR